MTTFTLATAEQLLADSQVNEFPVDFDAAWEWLGYSRKDNAWQSFQNAGFLADVDFRISLVNQENNGRGRPKQLIELTIDCMKQWAMMSGTSKGKEVRLYFIECERKLKQIVQQPQSVGDLLVAQAQAFALLERQQAEMKKMQQKHRELLEAQDERIANVEAQTTGHKDYYCLVAFVNTHGINMSGRSWSKMGKLMTDMSKRLGYEIKLVPDAKYGRIHAYHSDVLKRYFADECKVN